MTQHQNADLLRASSGAEGIEASAPARLGPREKREKPAHLMLGAQDLTIEDVLDVSDFNKPVRPSSTRSFIDKIEQSVSLVHRTLKQKLPIYGVNTNFGGTAHTIIPSDRLSYLQHNLLWGLKCNVGRDLSFRCVRAAMLVRANTLSRGASGVRLEIIERFLLFLNNRVAPLLTDLGSIGASGDLVPLSYIAGTLIGDPEFRVNYQGQTVDCVSVLRVLGNEPIQLEPKEGLALVNGTSVSSGTAAVAIYESERALDLPRD